jgi:hypothetical protein
VGGSSFTLRPGARAEEVSAFERGRALTLPADFREYLMTVNGMESGDSDDYMTSFWGLDRLKPVSEVYSPIAGHPAAPGDLVICDIMLDCFWYALRTGACGPTAGEVVMWGTRDFPIKVARSFTEFAAAYEADHLSLPRGLPEIDRPTTCPVHGVEMRVGQVGPWYGEALGPTTPSIYEAAVTEFPFPGVGHWGYEPVPPPEPRTWSEAVCPRCAHDRAEWIRRRREEIEKS